MRLSFEILASIAKNAGLLLWEQAKRISDFLHLGSIFRAVFWILGLPYVLFRKISEDGRLEIAKYAAPQHRLGALLLEMLFFPYHAYLDSTEGIGESEFDHEALKFWFTAGWLAIPVIILVIMYFLNYESPTG